MSAPCCSTPTIERRITPSDAGEMPPYSASAALPSSEARYLSVVRRSARSSSGSWLSSQYLKTSDRIEVCVSLRPRTLPSSSGPNEWTVARTWAPQLARQRQELDRDGRRLEGPVRATAPGRRPWGLPQSRRRHARDVTLDVGDEDGHARVAELAGQELQRLGLAGARRARDQAVAIEHRQGDLDADVGQHVGAEHRAADHDGRLGERVTGLHCRGEGGIHGTHSRIAGVARAGGL